MNDVVQQYIKDRFYGDLDLGAAICPNLTSLPENLVVRGNLSLKNSPIKTLPKGLRVEGKINLSGSSITTLPDDIKIEGSIDLTHSKIETLPDNLTIDGNLFLAGTKLKRLPKGLNIKGYLYMEHGTLIVKVEDLPGDLKVDGKILSSYFTDEEARKYLIYYQQIKRMEKKLPELEGIF